MTLLVADYLLDEAMTLRKGWAIRVDGTRITGVDPSESLKSEGWVNLGRAVLVPGFVNCHSHLELTSLAPEVHRTRDFIAWLDEVRELRDARDKKFLEASSREGLAQSLTSGVTTIANHCNSGLSLDAMSSMPARSFILYELIAFDRATLAERIPAYKKRIKVTRETPLLAWGLAPHAPYSVSEEFFRWIRKKRRKKNRILSIHLHEHADEGEFLRTGEGAFRPFLERLGIALDEFKPPGCTPAAYMEKLGLLGPKTLLIHCNYVEDEDFDIIKESGSTVVYCPRSHDYFYHARYPLEKFLERGVPVALGTDSLASNRSLSILDEMRFVRGHFPAIPVETLFGMATAAGAAALGLAGRAGALKDGMEADIAALGNLPEKGNFTLDDLLAPEVENVFTMVAGREVYKKSG